MTRSRIGLVGSRGYVGQELLKLFSAHDQLELAYVASSSMAGEDTAGFLPADMDGPRAFVSADPETVAEMDADIVVLALPNGLTDSYAQRLDPGIRILDLSADKRHVGGWVYGLTEVARDEIAATRRVANPGCYATAAQLAILPFKEQLIGRPQIFGVSGYSGAGTTPNPRNDHEMLRDNILPYALSGHIQETEISRGLGHDVSFLPHVAAFFRGLSVTISLELSSPLDAEVALGTLIKAYVEEPVISVTTEAPTPRQTAGTPTRVIGGCAVDSSGQRLTLVACLDNLLKGAASQALQNINLMLGWPETEGILP